MAKQSGLSESDTERIAGNLTKKKRQETTSSSPPPQKFARKKKNLLELLTLIIMILLQPTLNKPTLLTRYYAQQFYKRYSL